MRQATLNFVVVTKRMLTTTEAAYYSGRQLRRFKAECPVTPIRFPDGRELYDIRDVDEWLDSRKAGHDTSGVESIIEKLG